MAVIKAVRASFARLAPVFLALLVFAGMFARITMLARLSEKSKQISAYETQAERAQVKISQMELVLNELHDLDVIAIRAAEMGMKSPSAEQIRVLQIDSMQDTPVESGHEPADTAWREGWN